MPTYVVNYVPGANPTVTGGVGTDDTLVVNWGAATASENFQNAASDVSANSSGTFQAGFTTYVTFSGIENFQITSGAANDGIVTAGGNDSVSSGAGNDTINTRAGEAIIDGGSGTDGWAANFTAVAGTITVNLQANTITGTGASSIVNLESLGYANGVYFQTGAGNDTLTTLVGATATYGDYIQTNGGDDTVTVGGGDDTVDLGAGGNDLLIVDYSWSSVGLNTGSFANSGDDFSGNFQLGNTGDLVRFSNVNRFQVSSGSGTDSITTGDGNDSVAAGGGNDKINTGIGAAIIDGGSGTDGWAANFTAVAGTITVNLQANTITGTGASSIINLESLGYANGIYFQTGSGSDTLTTLVGATATYGDYIQTNGGDDTVTVGGGDDTVDLGAGGNDLLIVDYSWSSLGLNTGSFANSGGDFSGNFQLGNTGDLVRFSNVNRFQITSGSGADTITTGDGVDLLNGGAGVDTLRAGSGDDSLIGGIGADVLDGGAGFDLARYDFSTIGIVANLASPASNTGEAAGDTYTAIEGLVGSNFGDQLFGDGGGNALYGGNGDDALYGGLGADALDGGAGFDFARYDNAASAVTAVLFLPSVNTGEAAGDTYTNIEGLVGSGFDDNLQGDANANTILGLAGIDLLFGREGNDTLYAGDNDDHLWGGLGTDYIDGGAGYDYARYDYAAAGVTARLDLPNFNTGEAAGDYYVNIEGLVGSSFNDTLVGTNAGNDTLIGLDGDNLLLGLAGNDGLVGGSGNDSLWGGEGADVLIGGGGFDYARYDYAAAGVTARLDLPNLNTGEAAGDSYSSIEGLVGSGFGDTLVGNSGNNYIFGQGGNDAIYGLGGADNFFGGAGNDTFVFFASDFQAGVYDSINDLNNASGDYDLIALVGVSGADLRYYDTPSGALITNAALNGNGGIIVANHTLAQIGAQIYTA